MQLQDQLGRTIALKRTPSRIISLVPSQTELLFDLGVSPRIVGVTKFCVHPESARIDKTVVGGTKSVNIEKVKALQPDLIFCNKEENTIEMIEQLAMIAPVYVSDIITIEDCLSFIEDCGKLCQVEDEAEILTARIGQKYATFKKAIAKRAALKVAYFIWRDPWMVAGGGTFIHELLRINNFENIFGGTMRYPEIDLRSDVLKEATFIFLSSEPYPFKTQHIEELQDKFPDTQIVLVDGEYFSWYGSRLLKAFDYFKKLHLV